METHVIANRIRLDKGTETGVMATMHAFLRRNHGDCDEPADTILYGPSTSNQQVGNSYGACANFSPQTPVNYRANSIWQTTKGVFF